MRSRATTLEPEGMDDERVDRSSLLRALTFIRRINRLLRYNAATVRAINDLGGGSVLDVACGSGDLRGDLPSNTRYIGLDLHPTTLAIARQWQPGVLLVRGDALRLPFADGAFDVAVCQMFLHHLPSEMAVQVVREMDRVSRRGWVVADLLRRHRALGWITLFTLFADPMTKHDARTSVRQAWTHEEVRELAKRAGVEAVYRETFGHRFLLWARKAGAGGETRMDTKGHE